jgi:5-methylcytosine-specific restriction endonuclease McrA
MARPRANPHTRPWRQWYTLTVWRNRRAHQLLIEPTCRSCRQQRKLTAASVVDHIEPHGDNWNAFMLNEVQSLCAACHNAKLGLQYRGYDARDVGADGLPRDASHPFNVGHK